MRPSDNERRHDPPPRHHSQRSMDSYIIEFQLKGALSEGEEVTADLLDWNEAMSALVVVGEVLVWDALEMFSSSGPTEENPTVRGSAYYKRGNPGKYIIFQLKCDPPEEPAP